jgi:hypothetical protein
LKAPNFRQWKWHVCATFRRTLQACRLVVLVPVEREARMDLWTFGVRAYADCIAGTLSQNNVLPNGTYVEFDVEQYLSGEYSMGDDRDTQTPKYRNEYYHQFYDPINPFTDHG